MQRILADFDEKNNYVVGESSMAEFLDRVSREKELGYLLEIACGNATYTKVLAANAERIVATDLFAKQGFTSQTTEYIGETTKAIFAVATK